MTALANQITALPRDAQLRLALKLDAVVTGANGAAYVALAGPLEDLLGVEASLLRPTGAFLLAFAVFVAVVATRPEVPRAGVTAVIEANILWVIGSLAFVVIGVSSPDTAGSVWTVMQAAVVAGFAGLQARLS
jgi:hypothetical protein